MDSYLTAKVPTKKDFEATMAKSIPPNDGEKPDDLVQQVLDHRL